MKDNLQGHIPISCSFRGEDGIPATLKSRGGYLHKAQKGLVSVIIPTYNRAYVLGEAVKSVFEQSYKKIEIIVVDDGSTDNTQSIAASDLGAEVVYIRHNDNRGEAAATNTGVLNSRGEFIVFLDSDDKMRPEKINRQVAFMRADPFLDACFTRLSEVDASGVSNEWLPFCPPVSFCNSTGM